MVNKILLILYFILLSFILPVFSLAENGTSTVTETKTYSATRKPARSTEMEELLLFFDESELFVTAIKHPQPLQEAPAIATIITAHEIRNMGARNLSDILKTIPGIGISKEYQGKPQIEVRGIKSFYSERVKIMLDGHSLNDNITGGATWWYGDLNVDNVKRIEIIRGPGSALYGSNAFSAVINIITKNGRDINGSELAVGGGSYNTWKGDLQAGNKWDNNLETLLTLDYLTTDGARLHVEKDRVSASGDTDDNLKKIDAGLKMSYKDISFNSRYIAKKRGPYLGVGYAVNDETSIDMWNYFGVLSYKHNISDDVKVLAKAYVDELSWNAKYEVFSENLVPLPGSWPDGLLANPSIRERIIGTELQTDFSLADNNLLVVGAVFENRNQFDARQRTNYNPLTFASLGGATQDSINWEQDKAREVWAAYLQDTWEIFANMNLTAGVRHDQYSDFGSADSPRAALVWKFREGWDTKILFGQAFRAPTFQELYIINTPAEWGNPDLKAEKMTTYEASLGYTANKYNSRVSYFNNTFRDRIQLVADPISGIQYYQNKGGADVQGVEVELRKAFQGNNNLYLNYTYQWPKDMDSGERLAEVPTHKGNMGGNAALSRYINANVNIFASGERPRIATDTRQPLPAYALVDFTVIGRNFYPDTEVRCSIHNLLDKRYDDPTPLNTMFSDLPREGINFMVDVSYKF